MAAPETAIAGANVLLKVGGTQVGGQTGATFTHSAGAIDLAIKGQGLWGKTLDGEHEITVSLPATQTESDGTHTVGADGNVSFSVDDGSGAETVPGLQDLTVNLSNSFDDVASIDDPLWREVAVDGKDMEISTSGDYYDPESAAGAAYGLLFDLIDPDNALSELDFTATFGSTSVTGTIRATNLELDFPGPGEGAAQASFTLANIGAITIGGTAIDSGLQALLDAYTNDTKVTTLLELQDASGTPVSGATSITGDAFISSLELAGTRGEEVTINTELQGTGAWTTPTQA